LYTICYIHRRNPFHRTVSTRRHDDTTVETAYFLILFGFPRSGVGKRLPKELQATTDLSAGEYNWKNADQTGLRRDRGVVVVNRS
jgi:hypothetical protein